MKKRKKSVNEQRIAKTEHNYHQTKRLSYKNKLNFLTEEMQQLQTQIQHLQTENHQLKDKILHLEANNSSLEFSNKIITTQSNVSVYLLQEKSKEVEELKQNARIPSIVFQNSQSLIENLPSNSPVRRALIAELSKSLDKKELKDTWKISNSTIQRVENESIVDSALYLKYSPNTTRKRIKDEDLTFAKVLLDELLPVPSGRAYRVRSEGLQFIYEKYCRLTWQQNRIPIKWTSWIVHVINKEKIH